MDSLCTWNIYRYFLLMLLLLLILFFICIHSWISDITNKVPVFIGKISTSDLYKTLHFLFSFSFLTLIMNLYLFLFLFSIGKHFLLRAQRNHFIFLLTAEASLTTRWTTWTAESAMPTSFWLRTWRSSVTRWWSSTPTSANQSSTYSSMFRSWHKLLAGR